MKFKYYHAHTPPEDQAMSEIRRYKQMVRVDVIENIAKWRQVHQKECPRLAIVARKYLSVPATVYLLNECSILVGEH